MTRLLKALGLLLFALLPSRAKVGWLRARGHTVGNSVRLGASYYDIEDLVLGDGCRIGLGNVFKGMRRLELGREASIGRFNLFTCNGYFRSAFPLDAGEVLLGERVAITTRHYFDVQNRISVGARSLVAGIQTMFFTHQKGLDLLNESKPIVLGERVYIGAGSRVLPGTVVASNIIVGAGSVVGGVLDKSYSLYASPRAVWVKDLPPSTPFFSDPDATRPNPSD